MYKMYKLFVVVKSQLFLTANIISLISLFTLHVPKTV